MAFTPFPTPGNDKIVGDAANDFINGLAGNDTIDGGAGNDILGGNFGNDFLTGGLGNDNIFGDAGIDQLIESGDVNFTLTNTTLTGLGNDNLSGFESAVLTGGASGNVINASGFNQGAVTINGLDGNDNLQGGSRNDLLLGGIGNDRLIGSFGDDRLEGGDGNDIIVASPGAGSGKDLIIGGNGTDQLFFANASRNTAATFILTNASLTTVDSISVQTDVVVGVETVDFRAFNDNSQFEEQGDLFSAASFAGSVQLFGGSERDTLIGSVSGDTITGGGAGDDLVGEAGNDDINGGDGSDNLEGGNGNDTLDGGIGIDTLLGGNGDDKLGDGELSSDDINGYFGEGGNDTLTGAENSLDFFNGGAGNDLLNGGGGKNNFDFNSGRAFATADLGIDTISDFSTAGTNDLIRLADKTFTAITGSNGFSGEGFLSSADFAVVTSDAVAGSSSAEIVYNSVNGNVFYNQNTTAAGLGSGGQFAILTGSPDNLSASDFFLDVV